MIEIPGLRGPDASAEPSRSEGTHGRLLAQPRRLGASASDLAGCVTVEPGTSSAADAPRGRRDLWSLDEYVVVADLYLRRGRSSGVRDPEVRGLAELTGRTAASISRRLGNYDGTDRPGMGLKPVVGEALAAYLEMKGDGRRRDVMVGHARQRLAELQAKQRSTSASRLAPRLVDPEQLLTSSSEVALPATTRAMIRAEAQLVGRFRHWLDPNGERLRGMLIPIGDGQPLRVDLFDTRRRVLIEAKAQSTRETVRYAIGQLLDYRHLLDPPPAMAILLPAEPAQDLKSLLTALMIAQIWPDRSDFVDSLGGQLTDRSPIDPDADDEYETQAIQSLITDTEVSQ